MLKTHPQPSSEAPEPCCLPLIELEPKQCRWSNGRKRGVIQFCGEPTEAGSSYCPTHHKRAYFKRGRPLNADQLSYLHRHSGSPREAA